MKHNTYSAITAIVTLIFLALFFITEDFDFAVMTILSAITSAEYGIRHEIEKGSR